jgi:peptidoglycan hydrolase CwlO-like protein
MMQTERLIDRVRQMRDTAAEEIDDLERERLETVGGIDDMQRNLNEIDRDIAVKREIIAEYQELIRRLETEI